MWAAFQLDVLTAPRGYISFFEDVDVEEVNLIVGMKFVSCNGYVLVVHVLVITI